MAMKLALALSLVLLLAGSTGCSSGFDCNALNDRLDEAIESGDAAAEQRLVAEGESHGCLDS